MNFKEYQEETGKTAVYPKIGGVGILYPVLGLCGESGEVAEKLKKVFRDNKGIIDDDTKNAIEKELGDVLWYISECCTSLKLDLETVALKNIEKLQERKKNNTLHGSGDNR
jgi:NTP pyrophosphatase (non-canonical NTP hydrolase)